MLAVVSPPRRGPHSSTPGFSKKAGRLRRFANPPINNSGPGASQHRQTRQKRSPAGDCEPGPQGRTPIRWQPTGASRPDRTIQRARRNLAAMGGRGGARSKSLTSTQCRNSSDFSIQPTRLRNSNQSHGALAVFVERLRHRSPTRVLSFFKALLSDKKKSRPAKFQKFENRERGGSNI